MLRRGVAVVLAVGGESSGPPNLVLMAMICLVASIWPRSAALRAR